MNYRGSKIFDEYNEEELNNNKLNAEKRISLAKYVDRDQSNLEENSFVKKNFNNKIDDDSFIDVNRNVIPKQYQENNINANLTNQYTDKIALIKVLISNYLKEKELDM